jgi:hypothetical protein
MVVAPDTATLMYVLLLAEFEMVAVRITMALVPVVTVTAGLVPPPVRVAVYVAEFVVPEAALVE